MRLSARLSALAVATLLAACGGGSDVTAVKVAGDSLSDGGTFGFKFTVQGPSLAQTRIWVDYVADAADVAPLCARYLATSPNTVAANPNAASCTNHAVGGASFNVTGSAGDATPFSILQQLRDLGGRPYQEDDILLVNGGANDVAVLLSAYLSASEDNAASYVALLRELLSPQQVAQAAAAGQDGLAQAGRLYMSALADTVVDTLQKEALAKGAKRVVVLNAPDITRTPSYRAVLAGVAQSAGAEAAQQIQALAQSWVVAFNDRLALWLKGERRVALVDFYGALNQWLSSPAAYGLTNTATPACPVTGIDSDGLPSYSIATCTEAVAAATVGPNWNTHVFSDDTHGTPRTNQLMGQLVADTLRARGWL